MLPVEPPAAADPLYAPAVSHMSPSMYLREPSWHASLLTVAIVHTLSRRPALTVATAHLALSPEELEAGLSPHIQAQFPNLPLGPHFCDRVRAKVQKPRVKLADLVDWLGTASLPPAPSPVEAGALPPAYH